MIINQADDSFLAEKMSFFANTAYLISKVRGNWNLGNFFLDFAGKFRVEFNFEGV